MEVVVWLPVTRGASSASTAWAGRKRLEVTDYQSAGRHYGTE
jgi:hypothetical protein